ncbi:MAG: ABC transporter permease [Bacteroidetes bacterium]|nr:ABC transporter permease [Bacteroidota bacterium]
MNYLILPNTWKVFLNETGDMFRFTGRFFKEVFNPPYEFRELLKQCFFIGYKSLALVGITAFIMGLVITIQSRPTLVEFGAEAWLPKMVSVSLVREIAPVITALICAGKIGSSIGAELGSMKVTEQIDAMEVSGTNPFKYLVITRVIGIIGCYKGYHSQKGTEGVGQSANSAVVISSLLVFILDLIAVQIIDVLNFT